MENGEFKKLLEIVIKNKIICKKLDEIKLNTRKKIKVFLGVNLKNEYCVIVRLFKKNRFLRKDIAEIEKLIPSEINFRYKKKILIINSEICSKAKEEMREWKIIKVENGE